MSRISSELGVQSYCFRGFDENAKVAELVKEMGVNRIELCAKHVQFDEPDTHAAVIKDYTDAGVTISSIGVEQIDKDEAEMRNRFEFMKACGAKVMTIAWNISMPDERLAQANALADEYGVKLGIHNHGGQHWLGNSTTLDYIFKNCNKQGWSNIGLGIDTAWCIDSREDPVKWANQFADRLFGVHIKDFSYTPQRHPEDVVVGTGCLDLPAFCKAAAASGNVQSCVLEYEGDVNNPVPALKQCVEAVKAADA